MEDIEKLKEDKEKLFIKTTNEGKYGRNGYSTFDVYRL